MTRHWSVYISFLKSTIYFDFSLVPTSKLQPKKNKIEWMFASLIQSVSVSSGHNHWQTFPICSLCSNKMSLLQHFIIHVEYQVQMMNAMWISFMRKLSLIWCQRRIQRTCLLSFYLTTSTLIFVRGTLNQVAWLTLQWLMLGNRETWRAEQTY